MDLLHLFRQTINDEKLFHQDEPLLVAVSGGVDSVVLCELCKQAGFDFTIAHCNFRLRGEESEQDEQFVRQLAKDSGARILVKILDTNAYAAQHKLSLQVAARELRYEWFYAILNNETAGLVSEAETGNAQLHIHDNELKAPRVILTAHHADDNIETVLMNFFKGTGIAGLRGILPKQGKIVRPLLFARKASIQEYAMQNNLSYREDSSNASDKYTRNYFRIQLLPVVQKVFPQAEDNIAKNFFASAK